MKYRLITTTTTEVIHSWYRTMRGAKHQQNMDKRKPNYVSSRIERI